MTRDDNALDAWDRKKQDLMQDMLGPEGDYVMHALVPFAIGGGLDLYPYPHARHGTAIATQELTQDVKQCPTNRLFTRYELVMFTRHKPERFNTSRPPANDDSPFGKTLSRFNTLLNPIARYAFDAPLNPGETSEFPEDFGTEAAGACFVFDAYDARPFGLMKRRFGLLALIEVHRREMLWARKHGGLELLEKLEQAGVYPLSDMDRPPVV